MFNGHHFFRWSRPDRPFQRGVFKFIILDHLKDSPSYGYEIMRALEKRFHGFYVPSPGVLDPTLQMLEEMGYVTAAEQDSRKVYTVTDEGRAFLAVHGERVERIKNDIQNWGNPENSDDIGEAMREFGRLAQLLRVKTRTVDSEKIGRIRKIISRAYEDILKD